MPGTDFCFVDTAGRQVDPAPVHRELVSSREEQALNRPLGGRVGRKSSHKQLRLLRQGTVP